MMIARTIKRWCRGKLIELIAFSSLGIKGCAGAPVAVMKNVPFYNKVESLELQNCFMVWCDGCGLKNKYKFVVLWVSC